MDSERLETRGTTEKETDRMRRTEDEHDRKTKIKQKDRETGKQGGCSSNYFERERSSCRIKSRFNLTEHTDHVMQSSSAHRDLLRSLVFHIQISEPIT